MIAHAHRRIEQLQRQLAEHQALEQQRMKAALDKKQEEDEKISQDIISLEQEKLRAEFEVEKERLVNINRVVSILTKKIIICTLKKTGKCLEFYRGVIDTHQVDHST